MAPITRSKNFMAAQEIFESELRKNNSDVEILHAVDKLCLKKYNINTDGLYSNNKLYIEEAAEKGHSHACCRVGQYNLNDNIFDKSLKFLHKARDLGCNRSLFYLTEYYRLVSPIDEYKS
ncbi:12608_t:CDS:2, partial [Cetraspora pellucida]